MNLRQNGKEYGGCGGRKEKGDMSQLYYNPQNKKLKGI